MSTCRTPAHAIPSTTWSPRPKRARTWRATTASATATDRPDRLGDEGRDDLRTMYADAGARIRPEVKRRIMLGTYVLSAGLLRRVLPEGPAGPHADQGRLRSRVRARRRRRDAHQPDARLPIGERVIRSAADVPGRRLHGQREPGRPARDQRSLRVHGQVGLPIGLQLTGRAFDEATLRRVPTHTAPPGGRSARSPTPTNPRPEWSRSADPTHDAPEWATCTDEQLLATRMCDLKVSIAGTEVEQYIAQVNGELEARGPRPAALLAVRRVVHARRRAGRRHPLLPRPPAAREARARADARGRRRRSRDRA